MPPRVRGSHSLSIVALCCAPLLLSVVARHNFIPGEKPRECANCNARCWRGSLVFCSRCGRCSRLQRRVRRRFALRQRLLVLNRRRPRVWLRNIDRLMLVWLCRMFPSLLDTMVIVKPETVLLVRTISLRLLYGLVILQHARRGLASFCDLRSDRRMDRWSGTEVPWRAIYWTEPRWRLRREVCDGQVR